MRFSLQAFQCHTGVSLSRLLADLKACSSSRNLDKGRVVHQAAIESCLDSHIWVANTLIDMYGRCASLSDALRVFQGMQNRTVVSWNALLVGYVENGKGEAALNLFSQMERQGYPPSARTFIAALKACIALRDRARGKVLHALSKRQGLADMYVESTLVDMHAQFGDLQIAQDIFDGMLSRDVVSWTTLILGYVENGEAETSLILLSRMEPEGCEPNDRTFVATLKACTDLAIKEEGRDSGDRGRALHLLASRTGCDGNIFVANSLINMYAKSGSMEEACRSFRRMGQRDVVSWNALSLGYLDNGEAETALELILEMRCTGCAPNSTSFLILLRGCAAKECGDLHKAKAVHLAVSCSGCDSHAYVQSALVEAYCKCGSTKGAFCVFNGVEHPDIVMCTSLILGYAENGEYDMALDLFSSIGRRQELVSDERTFVAALKSSTDACCGQAVHLLAARRGCDSNVYVENTLIGTYARCGSMAQARRVFDRMHNRDVVSWTTLILGYAEYGEGDHVLELFVLMKRAGCQPSQATFTAVLKACGMLGALLVGRRVHEEIRSSSMQHDPVLANCLIDFYAKCGSLAEAEHVFCSLTTRSLVAWNTLMTGYSHRGDTERVFRLFERMQDSGLKPDGITFSCLLTACSHAGLVERGKHYFDSMSSKYGSQPELEHCTSMVDMLGRANQLEEAMLLLRSLPFSPDAVAWLTVLGSCRKRRLPSLGQLAFECLTSLEDEDGRRKTKNAGAAYALQAASQ